jgi:hypothetical protein
MVSVPPSRPECPQSWSRNHLQPHRQFAGLPWSKVSKSCRRDTGRHCGKTVLHFAEQAVLCPRTRVPVHSLRRINISSRQSERTTSCSEGRRRIQTLRRVPPLAHMLGCVSRHHRGVNKVNRLSHFTKSNQLVGHFQETLAR